MEEDKIWHAVFTYATEKEAKLDPENGQIYEKSYNSLGITEPKPFFQRFFRLAEGPAIATLQCRDFTQILKVHIE